MGAKHIYKATNTETGEVIEGFAQDLAERIGINVSNFYSYMKRERKVNGIWKIEHAEQQPKKQVSTSMMLKLNEWDALTGPIREYIRRRDNG